MLFHFQLNWVVLASHCRSFITLELVFAAWFNLILFLKHFFKLKVKTIREKLSKQIFLLGFLRYFLHPDQIAALFHITQELLMRGERMSLGAASKSFPLNGDGTEFLLLWKCKVLSQQQLWQQLMSPPLQKFPQASSKGQVKWDRAYQFL